MKAQITVQFATQTPPRSGYCVRGKRISADTPSPILMIPVTNVPTYVHRVRESA